MAQGNDTVHSLFKHDSHNAGNLPSVLLAEDDPMFRHIIHKQLEGWGYRTVTACDGNEAWEFLQQENRTFDLIILDWLMPGIKGIDLSTRIRCRGANCYQYILLVSSKQEKRDIVEGLNAGADDYLTKPFDIQELGARLRTGLRIISLQKELLRAQEELRFRASHDSLTGLWNGGAALELLSKELERADRRHESTGLLMIDVDHFKKVNDTYGHLIGDQVLREMASRISAAVRSYDYVGRYGGEEFIAVISNCSTANLQTVAKRTLDSVGSSPFIVSSTTFYVTVSIRAVESKNGMSREAVLESADAALYEAKRNGRNQIVIGPPLTGAEVNSAQPVQPERNGSLDTQRTEHAQ